MILGLTEMGLRLECNLAPRRHQGHCSVINFDVTFVAVEKEVLRGKGKGVFVCFVYGIPSCVFSFS